MATIQEVNDALLTSIKAKADATTDAEELNRLAAAFKQIGTTGSVTQLNTDANNSLLTAIEAAATGNGDAEQLALLSAASKQLVPNVVLTDLQSYGSSTKAEMQLIAQQAEDARDAAQVHVTTALGHSNDASGAAATAQLWATEAEDVEVSTGLYSAYHWAQKAEAYLTDIASNVTLNDTTLSFSAGNVQSAIEQLDTLKVAEATRNVANGFAGLDAGGLIPVGLLSNHNHTLSDITDAGTSAGLDVAATGDAAAGQVVKGDDSRLSDNRDPNPHPHVWADITDVPATLEHTTNKNVANGYAGLDANGKVIESLLPSIAVVDTYEAASEAAMLALDAQQGDIAIRSDLNKCFILSAAPASTLANWKELRTPTDAVLSVAGKTGAVTLEIADVQALQTALDGKSNTGHTHVRADITDLGTAAGLNVAASGDATAGQVVKGDDSRLTDTRTPKAHVHPINDVTGLQAALDGKSDNGHGHVINDVSGLQTALDGKTNTGHGHSISDVTGLQASLDGKPSLEGDAIQVPSGTTAERPDTPTTKLFRYNEDLNTFEGWNGVEWGPIGGALQALRETFTYTASGGETSVAVTPNGYTAGQGIVIKNGGVLNTAAGGDVDISDSNNLVFSEALAAGDEIMFIHFTSFEVETYEAVKYLPQTLTDGQKTQARQNIGAHDATNITAGTLSDDRLPFEISYKRFTGGWATDSVAGGFGLLDFTVGGVSRWSFGKTDGAESGNNEGGDFTILRFADDGSFIDDPFRISRRYGTVNFKQTPQINYTYDVWHEGNFDPATKLNLTGGTLSGDLIFSDTDAYVKHERTDRYLVLSGGNGWANTGGVLMLHGKDYTTGNMAWGAELITGDAMTLKADAGGRVMMPRQPAFSATAEYGSGYTGQSLDPVVFGNVDINVGSHYNPATGIFTAPVAGNYFFTAQAHASSGYNGHVTIRIEKNGVMVSNSWAHNGSTASGISDGLMCAAMVFLNAGDTVKVTMGTSKTANYITEQYWKFTGMLVG